MVTRSNRPEGEDLDDLGNAADQLDQVTDQRSPSVEVLDPAPPLGNAKLLAGALAAGREAFCMFTKLESPRRHLGDVEVQQLADVWAPVLDKHGIDLGAYMKDWGLEIAALYVTYEIATALHAGVKAEIEERKAARKKAAEAVAGDAPAQ